MLKVQFWKSPVVLLLLLVSTVAFAQQRQPRTPQERADHQMRWIDKNLGLTKQQSNKVYDIILYYAKEADKAKMDMPKGQDKKMERQGIRSDREKELREVLTPEQFSKLQAHVQEMKERHRERMGDRP